MKSITVLFALLATALDTDSVPYFQIRVVDEQTQRGIPLVELETTNNIRLYTDSNGLVAFYEPGLMDQTVFFFVRSHGYEFPKDGFGMAGTRLQITAGGQATLKLKRINIAERLYRVTGGGIYRDTVLLGQQAPIRNPVLNGLVFGQDSILNVIYRGKLYWFWGDTGWPAYPLGNFNMTGATSLLPSQGGLDPDLGVDLEYFLRDNGFTREMTPMPGDGPTWAFGFCVLNDAGRERMFAGYSKIKGPSMETYRRGLCEYNDEKGHFEHVADWSLDNPIVPSGHALQRSVGGQEYIFYDVPIPLVRVRATVDDLKDIARFEAFTCLKAGTTAKDAEIDRAPDDSVRWAWKRNTPALRSADEAQLVKSGALKPGEALMHLQDADTGKPIVAHAGSVYWNEYRKRWILIDCEIGGSSMLGETWYAEGDTALGPWVYARKVVTHDDYSFYNPKQHPYFDKDGGRIIYFEGTYTHTFSGNPHQTPRYDYNQIMYKLDLADTRLVLPVPVYAWPESGGPQHYGTRSAALDRRGAVIAFFALDRPRPGAVPVFHDRGRLKAGDSPIAAPPLFWALPADTKHPPATTVPLFEFRSAKDDVRVYSTDPELNEDGFTRNEHPLCLVWRSPLDRALDWLLVRESVLAPNSAGIPSRSHPLPLQSSPSSFR